MTYFCAIEMRNPAVDMIGAVGALRSCLESLMTFTLQLADLLTMLEANLDPDASDHLHEETDFAEAQDTEFAEADETEVDETTSLHQTYSIAPGICFIIHRKCPMPLWSSLVVLP